MIHGFIRQLTKPDARKASVTTYYRVTDWHDNFETSETKKLDKLKWVPIPNKQDGDGYTFLLDHPKGAAHFGCWTAMLQLASKCELRGSFLRKVNGEWIPHDAESIARITRMPKTLVTVAITRLLEIGWLEELAAFPGSNPGDAGSDPGRPCPKGSGSEVNGIEVKSPDGGRGEGEKADPKASPKERPTTTRPTWANKHPEDLKIMMASFSEATARPLNVIRYFRCRMQTKRDGDITPEWERRVSGMSAVEVFLVFANEPEDTVQMPSQFDDAKRRFFLPQAG